MSKISTLEKQLADNEKQANLLREKIEAEKAKNKPKNIMDIVKSYEDACKYKKVKPTLSYTNRKGRSVKSIAHDRLEFIFSVLNEGHKFKMDKKEARWYVWFLLDPSAPSGLVFRSTRYGDESVDADSASHLCFKNLDLAKHTAICPEILSDWGKFLIGK